MTTSVLRWISLLVVVFLAGAGTAAGAAEITPDGERTWVWIFPGSAADARHLHFDVALTAPVGADGIAQFQCDIRSDTSFPGGLVTLRVSDTEGRPVSEGTLLLDIGSGANTCRISLDTSAMALGTYRAVFSIDHTLLLDAPSQELILRKVNADKLLEELRQLEQDAAALDSSLSAADQAGRPNPYLRLKTNVSTDVLALAKGDADRGAWEALEQRLRFAGERLSAVRAGLVFEATTPELAAAVHVPTLETIEIQDGGFAAESSPVFLFGGNLPAWDTGLLAQLKRYQFNAATITVGPSESPGGDAAQSQQLQGFFEAARTHNVALALQLAPDQLPPAVLQAHPEITRNGFVDIADPSALAQWESYVKQLGPTLTGRSMLIGVSLAQQANFHFDGEAVKAGFLDFIRASYADRLTLNRSWRSHLGALEDITPWSTNPYDLYQQHRPYQFDWQTYHQSLGNAYFRWARALVQSSVPDTPLMTTMPNTVFEKGESRHGVNRERLGEMLQISGCSVTSTRKDPVYAMEYPEASVYFTLLKSFQPGQPVFNLRFELDAGVDDDTRVAYRYVHSAIWESVMSGLSGATVPMDSLVFQRPEALEGFATAALDVNRLAPIVHAFQTAPADVGVLFSYASKVFDDGEPHLLSAFNAYEGVSFGGYTVRFLSEDQCASGALDSLKILVVPDTPALGDEAFRRISEYVEKGGTVARTGTPIPYDERGYSRGDLIRNTGRTVLVRGLNLPTEFLHAVDAATVLGALPQIPRPITPQGYPVEGLKSRYVSLDGVEYLYLLNLRKEPVYCDLATPVHRGRDLIRGRDMVFPATIEPLTPMLIRLESARLEMSVTAAVQE